MGALPRKVTPDGRILEKQPDGTIQVVGTVGGVASNPLKVREATTGIDNTAAQTTGRTLDNRVAGATIAPQIQTVVAGAGKATADATQSEQQTRLNGLTSAQYSDALGQFNAAKQIQLMRRDLRQSFERGPGTTQGLGGLADFIPNFLNEGTQRYDNAANRMRAFAKAGTGTTGGENNSLAEMKLNLGAYIPSSMQFDSTNEDSHAAIGGLGDKAFHEAIQRLGGIPDEVGKVHPLDSPEGKKLVADYQTLAAAGQARPSAPGHDGGTPGLYDANGNFTGVDPRGGGGPNHPSQFSTGGYEIDPKTGEKINLDDIVGDAAPPPPMTSPYEQFLKDQLAKSGGGDPTSGQNYALRAAGGSLFGLQDEFSGARGALYSAFHGQNPMTGYTELRDVERMRQHQNEAGQGGFGTALEVGGSLPTAFMFGNGATIRNAITSGGKFGAVQGYGEGDGLTGSAMNAAGGALAGGAGGGAGGLLGSAIGRGVSGVASSPTIQRLREKSLIPTLGQIMRARAKDAGGKSVVADIEDAISNTPGAGSIVNTARNRALEQGNNAAYRIVGNGAPIDGVGRPALTQLHGVKTRAYGDALKNVSLPATDPRFIGQVSAADAAGRKVDGLRGKGDFAYVMDHELAPLMNGGQQINGRQLQDALRVLKGNGRAFSQAAGGVNPDPAARGVANALGGVEGAFTGLTARHAPGAIPGLKIANKMNRGVNVLEEAANREGEVFTGPQLMSAIRSNGIKFGQRGLSNTSKSPLFQHAQDMTNALPNKIPPTGVNVSPFLAGAGLLAGGANEQTGYDSNIIRAASMLALLSSPYTKTGSSMVAKTLLDRSPALRAVGTTIRKKKGLFGSALAPLALEFGN